MPELPEVEVVRAGLEPAVVGSTISQIEIFDQRSLKKHNPVSGDFAGQLVGRVISSSVRRGKFLWFPLRDVEAAATDARQPRALAAHLGMSGQMLLREPGAHDKLTRIRLFLEHPDHGELWVNFVDQRIFGGMAVDQLVPTPDGFSGGYAGLNSVDAPFVPHRVAHIARDPLDPHFDRELFTTRLLRKATGIKRALLDQTLISGIGNIYADEALWASELHGEQRANTLTVELVTKLLDEVRSVLQKALAEGGTSFDAQYVNVNGASGYFSHSLNAYGQQGKPCPRCGTPIVRETFMNRGSHFCPRCQPLR